MAPEDFHSNHYLVYLVLKECALQSVTAVQLPNLRHLDLSHNHLHNISVSVFNTLGNLNQLSLANNPLSVLVGEFSSQTQRNLKFLDLSNTQMVRFNTTLLSYFVSLQRIDLSRSLVNVIGDNGFQNVRSLVDLDLSGCPVETFPNEIFHGLTKLSKIVADTYKLCCVKILPANFDPSSCQAPENELSSCDDLLRSETYRGFLWLMGALSLSGNVFCLVFRSILHRKSSKGAFNVFVSSLCLADFTMGVYVIIIGVADLVYRGTYLHNDLVWMDSVACKVAGFLCLVSSEVSALTILLITVDRFLVLRFPFSRLWFGRVSGCVACLSTWVVGFVFALVPLLPATAHWKFYSQTGICIPLPITRQDFAGRQYSLGVMIILNSALFLLIAGGQAVIYWSVRVNSLTSDTGSWKTKDMTVARRLITVAVSDFLCWFPISLCALLALGGVPVPGEVNVAMAIFVLPLNSAFNPFLYTVNMMMEKRQRASQDRLLERLKATLDEQNLQQ
jgi:hypothetical protein